MRATIAILSAFLAVSTLAATPARAVDAPYEERLLRLAEVLGSLHYLRNLCGETGNLWREQMEALLASENPTIDKRARFVARFNRGYRSFAETHVTCTESTMAAIERYMKEGEALSRDTAAMFGN
ncbi:TIGR02301 family protein [Nitratireductor sp. CAU 1489]|uniref:TIGR02301 family protein n=1 Tax=Nitratireductor arenosus TaxID=2682096 RepID=A0A844QNY1_9HYPH|nr:TIGR02301 family protein [Nitratireductor arenosus]MVA99660.1 TIGR02301 family protein [Nitratireductor arenosus]